jgi:diguanylate cyclase (GGDEF)-like protein/PAS domain S-box-containing protein
MKPNKQNTAEEDAAYRLLVENLEDYAVFMMDFRGNIATWNKGAERQFGYKEKEVLGKNFSLIFTKEDQALNLPKKELIEARKNGRADDERQHVHKNGKKFWCSGVVVKFEDKNGKFVGLSKIVRDISEKKKAEETIKHQAMHDTLTGLANRRLMFENLAEAISASKKEKEVFALAFVDLDKFKNLNDTEGHDTGDLLLQEVAVKLAGSVRQEDTVARFGGDEFIILLRNIKNAKFAKTVVEKILASLQPVYIINNKKIQIKGSIGVVLCPDHGKDMARMLKHADVALYQAKASGGNCFQFYTEQKKKSK